MALTIKTIQYKGTSMMTVRLLDRLLNRCSTMDPDFCPSVDPE